MREGNTITSYTYDSVGNITTVKVGNTLVGNTLDESYTYDALGQLKTAFMSTDVGDYDWVYTYDDNGNIQSADVTGYTFTGIYDYSYAYEDPQWRDKLTSVNGNTITYDAIGNPLQYWDGKTFSWMQGRKLAQVTDGNKTVSFTYNADGGRHTKTVNGVTTQYYYVDGVLYAQKTGDNTLFFLYDEQGVPFAMKLNGTTYYYQYNLQGDVIGLYDSTGDLVVEYEYSPWGKVINETGIFPLSSLNPFRYRGYYYDTETKLYYLNSRYYDPEIGRFINADSVMGVNSDMATYNQFAYCGNNPVVRYDNSGMFWKALISGVIHAGNNFAVAIGIDTAAIGAFFLMMEQDSSGVYHARQDCWQQYGGYNDLYDFAFNLGTSMQPSKFPFSCNGAQYMIWAWKGDYINLGAGAELGIYVGNGPHYFVDTSQAMSMCMGLMYEGANILWYAPSEKQWWITGFNPEYQNKKASQLTAVFGINFNSQSMYDAFYGAYKNDSRVYAFIPSERGVVIKF